MTAATAHSYVMRDTVTAAVFWLAVALGITLAGAPILSGDVAAVTTTAPIVAFVLWILWIVLFHPHVRYDEERVVVTNIGSVHELPWTRVVTVRQHLALTFELDDGRRIRAIGVTAPRGRGLVLSGLTRGKMGAGSTEFHQHADALRGIQAAAATASPATAALVVSRPDTVPLAIGAVLAAGVLVDVVVLLTL